MNKIEHVQRKYTIHMKGLHNVSYEERLNIIQLPSTEYCQLIGDMIQVYKIDHYFYDTESTRSIFKLPQTLD